MTAGEFIAYPFEEDKRYELDDGELVVTDRPPCKHNRVLKNLLVAVENFLNESGIGEALISENVYALSPSICRSPDLSVILGDHTGELRGASAIPITPDAVMEVLCEIDTIRVIHRKLRQYFQAGVKEVWLIDPEVREVEIWTGPTIPGHALTENAVLESPLLPGFKLSLEDLFA